MKKQTLAALFAVILSGLTLTSQQVLAKDFRVINAPVYLNVRSDDTISFSLGKEVYLKNLIIQAEGIVQDSTVEVMVNGNVKGTLYAPGRDPSYVVTVEETTSSIQFRHRAGGTMRISNILATVADSDISQPGASEIDKTALAIGERTIQLIIALVPYSSLQEEATYLIPMKIAAGKLKSMVLAHGVYASETRLAMQDLQAKMESADSFLLLKMESESLFDEIVEIYSIKETIKDLLN